MTEKKQTFNTVFGNNNSAGICGPDGCSIIDHQKKARQQDDKDK